MTVTMAAEGGQLQLNVMEPVISYSLFNSILFLSRACDTLRLKAIDGITANAKHTEEMVMRSVGIVTLLNPIIGYEESSSIAKEALNENKSIYEIAVTERKLITQEKWDELFKFDNLINPKFIR
jgi:aspartate ammonia-lyase